MSAAAPSPRHVVVGGRALMDIIAGALEQRLGAETTAWIETRGILESLLEEYFYGGSFQDQFYETLNTMRIPTDVITFVRREIMNAISTSVSMALGGIRPCNQYSFQLTTAGDVYVTEIPPTPMYRSPKPQVDHADCRLDQ